MVFLHLTDVHLVDVVGGEDADPVGVVEGDEVEVLVDGVRRPLKPVFPPPHLGGDEGHEEIPAPEGASELPPPLDMFIQGLAFKLDENIN